MGLYTSIIYTNEPTVTDEIAYSYMYERKPFKDFDLTGFQCLHSLIIDYAKDKEIEKKFIEDDGYILFSRTEVESFILFCKDLVKEALKSSDFVEVADIGKAVSRFQEAVSVYSDYYFYKFG